jgi:CheY-like chemotaxis protein
LSTFGHARPLASRRILVVEDILGTINGLLIELTERFGCEIVVADTAARAIDLLSQDEFAGMILDWRIPLEDGAGVSDDGGHHVLEVRETDPRLSRNFGKPFVIATGQQVAIDDNIPSRYEGYLGKASKLLMDNIRLLLAKELRFLEEDYE